MNEECKKTDHLTQETLVRLTEGRAEEQEKIRALAHIAECPQCAGVFAEAVEEKELLSLPPDFGQGVERKLSQVRLTATPLSLVRKEERAEARRIVEKRDQKKEYRRYSCRVAIAACLTLLLLFSGTFAAGLDAISRSRVLNPDLSVVNRITQNLSDFSKELIHWEVKSND